MTLKSFLTASTMRSQTPPMWAVVRGLNSQSILFLTAYSWTISGDMSCMDQYIFFSPPTKLVPLAEEYYVRDTLSGYKTPKRIDKWIRFEAIQFFQIDSSHNHAWQNAPVPFYFGSAPFHQIQSKCINSYKREKQLIWRQWLYGQVGHFLTTCLCI